MPVQLSVTVRNARLDAIEAAIGVSPILRIRTGGAPGSCAAGDQGVQLAQMTLGGGAGGDWMAPAGTPTAGQKAKNGTWQAVSADVSGSAAHFRIYNPAGTVCHLQGSVTATGGGGDMTLDTVAVIAGQAITITGFTLTDGNP